MRRYSSIYLPECPFEVTATNRYTVDRYEASVTARSFMRKGETIKYLNGLQVNMTEEEEEDIKSRKRDFSVVVSARSKVASLFLGPARFANHDCDANSELVPMDKNMMYVVARKDIDIGEEITVTYSEGYFGEDNCECLCSTCETRLDNGWKQFDTDGNRILPAEAAPSSGDDDTGKRVGLRKRRADTDYRDIVPQNYTDAHGNTSQQVYRKPKGFSQRRENLAEDGTVIMRKRRKNLPREAGETATPEGSMSPVKKATVEASARVIKALNKSASPEVTSSLEAPPRAVAPPLEKVLSPAPPSPGTPPKPRERIVPLPRKYSKIRSIYSEALNVDFQEEWVTGKVVVAPLSNEGGGNGDGGISAEDEVPQKRRQSLRSASTSATPIVISDDEEEGELALQQPMNRREVDDEPPSVRIKEEAIDPDFVDLPSPPKRKGRGRPRKKTLSEVKVEDSDAPTPPRNKGGRPRKHSLPNPSTESQPKKRGPRGPYKKRRATMDEPDASKDIDSDDIPVAIKRTVKPNMSSLNATLSEAISNSPPLKRGRGRPRKRALSVGSDDTPIRVFKREQEPGTDSESDENASVLAAILNEAVKAKPKAKNPIGRPRKVQLPGQMTMSFGTSPKSKTSLKRPSQRQTLDNSELLAMKNFDSHDASLSESLDENFDKRNRFGRLRGDPTAISSFKMKAGGTATFFGIPPKPMAKFESRVLNEAHVTKNLDGQLKMHSFVTKSKMNVVTFGTPPKPMAKLGRPRKFPLPEEEDLDDIDMDADVPKLPSPKKLVRPSKRSPTKQEVMAAASERPLKMKAFRTKQKIRHSTSRSSMAATSFYAKSSEDASTTAHAVKIMSGRTYTKPTGAAAHKRLIEKKTNNKTIGEAVRTPSKTRFINPMLDDPPTDEDYEIAVPSPLIRRLKRPRPSMLRHGDSSTLMSSTPTDWSPAKKRVSISNSPLKRSTTTSKAPSIMEISSSSEYESEDDETDFEDIPTLAEYSKRLPSPTAENEQAAHMRFPGDYRTTGFLLPLPTSIWIECPVCVEQFVQPNPESPRLCCPRCDRHSKLYGLIWPKTLEWDGRTMVERARDWKSVIEAAKSDEGAISRKSQRVKLRDRVSVKTLAAIAAINKAGEKWMGSDVFDELDDNDEDADTIAALLNAAASKGNGEGEAKYAENEDEDEDADAMAALLNAAASWPNSKGKTKAVENEDGDADAIAALLNATIAKKPSKDKTKEVSSKDDVIISKERVYIKIEDSDDDDPIMYDINPAIERQTQALVDQQMIPGFMPMAQMM